MQASRTFRYIKHRPLRTLLSLRSLDSVFGASITRINLCPQPLRNEFDGFSFRSQCTASTDEGKDLMISAKAKHTSQLPDSATDKTMEDFDITLLLDTKPNSKYEPSSTYEPVLEWHSAFIKAKQEGNSNKLSDLWTSTIHPNIHKIVEQSFRETLSPEIRVKCLELLLYYDEGNVLTKKVLKPVLKSARYLSIKTIVDVINLLTDSGSSKHCKRARKELVVTTVEHRWFEMSHKHIIFFLYQLDDIFNMKDICFNNRNSKQNETEAPSFIEDKNLSNHIETTDDSTLSTLKKSQSGKPMLVNSLYLENRLITRVDDLKPKDLARVVTLMGKWRNRNQTLLLAVVHRLSLADITNFSLIQLSNLLFACSVLSIHSSTLLSKLTSELTSRKLSSPASVSSILSSLSHLRWYNRELVSNCVSQLSTSLDAVTAREARSILMSLANLYAVPLASHEISVIKFLSHRCMSECETPSGLVDAVWSVAVLQILDGPSASNVLQPEFIQQFSEENSFVNENTIQKLRGISLSASLELKGYEGPWMEEDLLNVVTSQNMAKHKELSSLLMNALGKFLDLKTYVNPSQSLSGGIHADAVMCSDFEGNPRPIEKLTQSETKDKHFKLILQVIPYNNVLTSELIPCGNHQMTGRHLKQLGYIPVQIPYSDLRRSQSAMEHVNAIQRRIKEAVHDHRNPSNSSTMSSTSSSES